MLYLFKKINLLPLKSLVKTSEVDHADWNYRPLLSIIQKMRFKIIATLLGKKTHYHRILEAGYGSGVFMPYLNDISDELYGVDPHEFNDEVQMALKDNDIKAQLFSASVTDIPLEDNFVDAVVIVSAIEYVDDIEKACKEIIRVLKPDGYLIVVTPGQSAVVDFGLKMLTGESAEENYDSRRNKLQPALHKYFNVERKINAPPLINPVVKLYSAFCFSPK